MKNNLLFTIRVDRNYIDGIIDTVISTNSLDIISNLDREIIYKELVKNIPNPEEDLLAKWILMDEVYKILYKLNER